MAAEAVIPKRADSQRGYLRVESVCKSFRTVNGEDLKVLDNCSLEVEPGKLTVVMGGSGCGKSTLAYILAGYLTPDRGTIALDGQPLGPPGADRVLVFQETALWPWMTVSENVTFGPVVRREMKAAEARRIGDELLDRFGLCGFRDKYPGQLSGGMKRRAEIAQALINRPKVMILDEPFRGLDVMTRELMQEYYLRVFEETRLTTLFITSELEEALFLADRLLIMGERPGRVSHMIEVDLPRPRNYEVMASDRYEALKAQALAALDG